MVIEIVVANYVGLGLFLFLVMSCGMPVPPVNGSIVGQDFSLGARAAYQCNPGFRLTGSVPSSVTCQESGRWSHTEAPPRCLREYSFLPAAPFQVTLVVFTSKTPWDVFTDCVWPLNFTAVTCPDIGHSAVEHGRWRLIYGTQNQYDAIMMLVCDPGYYYKGQRIIRCQVNGTWNYPDPRPICESMYSFTTQV